MTNIAVTNITLGSHICPLTDVVTYAFFGKHITSLSFMSMNSEIVHTCVSVQNAHVYQLLKDSYKYFTFG